MAFKMKEFSGFGNSPLKDDKKKQPTVKEDIATLEKMWTDSKQYKRLVAAGAPPEAIAKARAKFSGIKTEKNITKKK